MPRGIENYWDRYLSMWFRKNRYEAVVSGEDLEEQIDFGLLDEPRKVPPKVRMIGSGPIINVYGLPEALPFPLAAKVAYQIATDRYVLLTREGEDPNLQVAYFLPSYFSRLAGPAHKIQPTINEFDIAVVVIGDSKMPDKEVLEELEETRRRWNPKFLPTWLIVTQSPYPTLPKPEGTNTNTILVEAGGYSAGDIERIVGNSKKATQILFKTYGVPVKVINHLLQSQ